MDAARIDRKSTGTLIDELITTSMKCWHAQERVCSSNDIATVAAAAQDAQSLNKRRCDLIRAIDGRLNEQDMSPTPKTY